MLDATWKPHSIDADVEPIRPAQTVLPFWDADDALTTSQAARLLEMSAENVRVLAREKVLHVRTVVKGGERFFSRKNCLAVKTERELHALWTGQPTRRIRMPYAAYRSGGR